MWIFVDSCYAGRCRGCGRPIVWAETKTGAKHPFDVTPIAQATQSDLFSGRVLGEVDTDRSRSHWATCPNATSFRGGGK